MPSRTRSRIALVTAASARGTDDDEPILLAAVAAAGAAAEVVDWDDPAADFAAFDIVVLRSTWDYTGRRAEFLAWTRAVATRTRLCNAPEVVAWNSDKTYLQALAAAGAPIVPTTFLQPGDVVDFPDAAEFVVKPTVSAGSRDTARYGATELDRAGRHARALLDAGRTVMVQPYQTAVDEVGETALVFVDGLFSHAANKAALLEPGRDAMSDKIFAEESMRPATATAAELAVADRVLAAMPFDRTAQLYARVDLVPGPDGPLLLELELVEPSLFLPHAPADRVAAVAAAIIERAGTDWQPPRPV